MQGWGQFPLIHLLQFFWGGYKQWRILSSCRSSAELKGSWDDIWPAWPKEMISENPVTCNAGRDGIDTFQSWAPSDFKSSLGRKMHSLIQSVLDGTLQTHSRQPQGKNNPIRSLFLSMRRGRGAAQLMCGWEKSCRAKVGRRWHNPTVGMYYYLCCFQCSSYTFQSENWMRI